MTAKQSCGAPIIYIVCNNHLSLYVESKDFFFTKRISQKSLPVSGIDFIDCKPSFNQSGAFIFCVSPEHLQFTTEVNIEEKDSPIYKLIGSGVYT